jgi:hypothetical protein
MMSLAFRGPILTRLSPCFAFTPPFLFFFPHLSPQRGVVVESERASYTSFLQRSS